MDREPAKVLFVDDEIGVLNSIKRGLLDESYLCFFAASGEEALEIMQKEDISVIVTDMKMPGMDGLTLLKAVKKDYPATVRVVLSGYTQPQQVLAILNEVGAYKFITKPWKLEDEFKGVIAEAIEYYNLRQQSETLMVALEKRNIAYQKILRSISEQLSEDRKDFESIKNIGESLFNCIIKYVEGEVEKHKLEEVSLSLNIVKLIYIDFFAMLSAESSKFSMSQLSGDLKHYFTRTGTVKHIDMKADNGLSEEYSGNYQLLFGIITSIYKYVSIYNSQNEVKIRVRNAAGKKRGMLDFMIEIDMLSGEKDLLDAVLRIIEAGLQSVCGYIGGGIAIYRQQHKVFTRLQAEFC